MSELMQEGINLMLMGMGTVFVFLTFLVIGTTLMSRLIRLTPGNTDLESQTKNRGRKNPVREDLSELAAVAAAVKVVHER